MKNFLILFSMAFIILLPLKNSAQTKTPFESLPNSYIPQWAKQIDWNKPNIKYTDSLFAKYRSSKNEEDEPEEDDDEKFKEDPFELSYIRWRKEIEPFIQPDGSLAYNQNYYRERLLLAINNSGKMKRTIPASVAKPSTAAGKTMIQKSNALSNNTTAIPSTSGNWSVLGPVLTYQPGGSIKNQHANMYRLAIAASNPNTIYAFSESGVIFKSYDKGLHWISVSDMLPPIGGKSIVVDPHNENIVYCYSGNATTILKSTDGAATWTALTNGVRSGGDKMIINPNNGRILITSSADSVFYSDDNGATWNGSIINSTLGVLSGGRIHDLVQNLQNPNTVYAIGNMTGSKLIVLRSINNGNSFTQVYGNNSSDTATCSSGARITSTIADSSILYGVTLGKTYPCIVKSIDGGQSWKVSSSSTTTSLTGANSSTALPMSNGQGYYDLGILANPNNANNVIVGSTNIYMSTDGGVNFSPLGGYYGNFDLHPDLQNAVTLSNDTYLATDGGINYSSDFFASTTNWSVRDSGLTAHEYWGFGQGWDQDITVGGSYHNGNAAMYENYGTGNSLEVAGGDTQFGTVFHGQDRVIGFGYSPNTTSLNIVRTIPTALSGSVITPSIGGGGTAYWPNNISGYGAFTSEISVHPNYANVYFVASADSVLWKSVNTGSSYIALHNFGKGNSVGRFEVCSDNPYIIYVCVKNGVYKSTDGGNTWNLLTLPVTYSFTNTDIAVNPSNNNEVYLCMAKAAANSKVFQSLDGGNTWTNYTGTQLNNLNVSYLQFQAGTQSGLYAIVSNAPSATSPNTVYYRDNTMSDWVSFSSGLPMNVDGRNGALIFYRDGKLRLGTGSRGVMETPLYPNNPTPVARPMADKFQIGCSTDTINFFDYSFINYAGATRKWSFPGAAWVSSDTAFRPRVVYSAGGNFDVTLTVTDSSGNSNTKTMTAMINNQNLCGVVDTVPGSGILLPTTSAMAIGKIPVKSNNFSISCWVKPNGLQQYFSNIISQRPYPGSGGTSSGQQNSTGFAFGFGYGGGKNNLELYYMDSTMQNNKFTEKSGLICDTSKWNFVVLTYSPTGVTLYLNGVGAVVNSQTMPIIDLSQNSFSINTSVIYNYVSRLNSIVDEVKFYNYALSQSEIREKMHIINPNVTNETGLISYNQFNKYTSVSNTTYDLVTGNGISVPASYITSSSAPVSTGIVYRNPNVTAAGSTPAFSGADVDIYWNTDSTAPNGELVAFHLNNNPNGNMPGNQSVVPGYFIINNYGTNTTFSIPDSIRFNNVNIGTYNNFTLYKRAGTDYTDTSWKTNLGQPYYVNRNGQNSTLSWKAPAGLTSFSQFGITASNITLPIFLQSFNVSPNNNKSVLVNWATTGSGNNVKGFEIQRSTNNYDFSPIKAVSYTVNNYSLTDNEVIGGMIYYYRLKMLANDGSFSYSAIRSVSISNGLEDKLTVYPNPLKGNILNVQYNAPISTNANIVLMSISGSAVYQANQPVKAGNNLIALVLPKLTAGTYILKLYTQNGNNIETKVIVL